MMIRQDCLGWIKNADCVSVGGSYKCFNFDYIVLYDNDGNSTTARLYSLGISKPSVDFDFHGDMSSIWRMFKNEQS